MSLKQNRLRMELDSVPDGLVPTCGHWPDFVPVASSKTPAKHKFWMAIGLPYSAVVA